MIRFLLISSFVLCLLGCKTYPKKEGFKLQQITSSSVINPYFSNPEKDYIYTSTITFNKHVFSGILVVKKIAKGSHRVVFTTEMGNKIFDFSFTGQDFKVNYILSKIDKKIIVNLLKKDFQILIKEESRLVNEFLSRNKTLVKETVLNKSNLYYYYKDNLLENVERVKSNKKKVVVTFSEVYGNSSKKIDINHFNLNLSIKLKSIK